MIHLHTTSFESLLTNLNRQLIHHPIHHSLSGVLLASGSPRRKDMLTTLFGDLQILPSISIKEPDVALHPRSKTAEYLALLKLAGVLRDQPTIAQHTIITSDTVVYRDEAHPLLGKPRSRAEGKKALLSHLGHTNNVTSACVILDVNKRAINILSDTTQVHFKTYSTAIESIIDEYISLAPPLGPLDKAGAYGIQEPLIRDNLIESVDGDLNTVIGFPLEKFKNWLKNQSSNG